MTTAIPDLRELLDAYYRHVAPEDLEGRSEQEVRAAALSHREVARSRRPGTAIVRVATPPGAARTVVEVATDDMPFLVDSLTAEISRQGLALHLVVHPQLLVRRDDAGELIDVVGCSEDPVHPDDVLTESWIRFEVERVGEEAACEQLAGDLRRVLGDVRAAVEDWPHMQAAAREGAAALAADGDDADELLEWLADHRFTFLASARYDLAGDALVPTPGSGLGLLREGRASAVLLEREVRERGPQRVPLVVTKSGLRSTVHRPAHLDDVGVLLRGPDGAVVGQQRFLGLFASVAYTESVHRVPVVRRKVAQVLALSGYAEDSHTGNDLLTVLETFPRDELFQIDVDDLLRIVTSVLHLRERRQLRLFLRRDAYGRFMSALVYLPRDRYTTEVRLVMAGVLRRAFGVQDVDYTARVTESVLARLHFVVRGEPGADAARRRRPRARGPAGRRGAVVERRPGRGRPVDAAAAGGRGPAAGLRRGVPGGLPGGLPGRRGGRATCSGWPRWCPTGRSPWRCTPARARRPTAGGSSCSATGRCPLSQLLPVLQSLGVDVVDERPYEIERGDGRRRWVYDVGLRLPGRRRGAARGRRRRAVHRRLRRGVVRPRRGRRLRRAGDPRAARLAAGGGAARVRALPAAGGLTFSSEYVEEVLAAHVGIVRLLVQLFEALFDPATADEERAAGLAAQVTEALDDVASLDDDRILRALLALVQATVRTNHYQLGPDGHRRRTWRSSSTRAACPTCRRPGRGTRSGSTARGSRACTCASAPSPAAACAGRTAARTSAPRCSAWSRRRP